MRTLALIIQFYLDAPYIAEEFTFTIGVDFAFRIAKILCSESEAHRPSVRSRLGNSVNLREPEAYCNVGGDLFDRSKVFLNLV